jgi:hypothetical protein
LLEKSVYSLREYFDGWYFVTCTVGWLVGLVLVGRLAVLVFCIMVLWRYCMDQGLVLPIGWMWSVGIGCFPVILEHPLLCWSILSMVVTISSGKLVYKIFLLYIFHVKVIVECRCYW